MIQIDSMLARWRSLYGEWVIAELELRDVRQRRPGSRGVAMLEAKVRRLKDECQAALDETSEALASPDGGMLSAAQPAAGPLQH